MRQFVAIIGLLSLFANFSMASIGGGGCGSGGCGGGAGGGSSGGGGGGGSGGAIGPRFLCRSDDQVKMVRIKPAAFGQRMQAELSHNGSIYQILPCEMDVNDALYYCTDGDMVAPRIFTLGYDYRGHYEGTRETRDFGCREVR